MVTRGHQDTGGYSFLCAQPLEVLNHRKASCDLYPDDTHSHRREAMVNKPEYGPGNWTICGLVIAAADS
ncbi:hypothetical protein CLAIMM_00849 [Cladophialophora immunda]|nr:hypothetical protein CLAIMM_00849 [Cladophialophora immunda]